MRAQLLELVLHLSHLLAEFLKGRVHLARGSIQLLRRPITAGLATAGPATALELFPHPTRHLFEMLGGFVQTSCAQVLDRFHQMLGTVAAFSRRKVIPAAVGASRLSELAPKLLSFVIFAGALERFQFARTARFEVAFPLPLLFLGLPLADFRLELFAPRHQLHRDITAPLLFGDPRLCLELFRTGAKLFG